MLGRVNAPSLLLSVDLVKAEWAAASVMWAAGSGRCWGSWTTPWSWEKTVARAMLDGSRHRSRTRRRTTNPTALKCVRVGDCIEFRGHLPSDRLSASLLGDERIGWDAGCTRRDYARRGGGPRLRFAEVVM